MNFYVYIVLVCILSYFMGCFSTARIMAKTFRSMNIYKVGTGYPDTENIFSNISKSLGIAVGAIDIAKMYMYLCLLSYLHSYLHYPDTVLTKNITLFIFGFFVLLGHTLPVTSGFRGGRGVFNYTGLLLFFIPIPVIVVLVLSFFLIMKFKQIRFSNFIIVLLPPFIAFFMNVEYNLKVLLVITAALMGILNLIVCKRLGEI
ncbi:MAG: glycerol-3-phosphate acyltransferase [Candidatus Cloacimonadales bacterium]|nr:glycerol-3-phosphate acyltransferase [Candidatus Cloacimonadota bacterium]MDD2649552.1 glycerol-3-phosphate acyltransferase [Candidatus Cloacimonadota bacterium]MDX9977428.1 glycerol-3-phosphate acyltransferase [Candidatus Cloacimonadales bacterium]